MVYIVKSIKPYIVTGDFNKVLSARDRNPARSKAPRVTKALTRILETRRLVDGWRYVNPDELEYTFWSSNRVGSTSRIDRIYCTEKVYKSSTAWQISVKPS